MILKDQIHNLAKTDFSQVIDWRRHLHQNPELSFEEYETSKYVVGLLKSFGGIVVKNIGDALLFYFPVIHSEEEFILKKGMFSRHA